MDTLDALIVGGGPAGLSAALILGRCRRRVHVCDAAHYRNEASYAMYGFLSRDGISPKTFLEESRRQLQKYSNVSIEQCIVSHIQKSGSVFYAEDTYGHTHCAKTVILATGINDQMPDIVGIQEFFGRSVFLCPYCDGWEFKDQRIAVYGQGDRGPCFALLMSEWSKDIVLCTDGPVGGSAQEQRRLEELGIPIIEKPIRQLKGSQGRLQAIEFIDGSIIECQTLFFNTPIEPKNHLAQELGCEINSRGEVVANCNRLTQIEGVFAAGDASQEIKLAIVAAAEGAKAAYAANKYLLKKEHLVLKS